jgi:hypothetical protein
MQLLTQNAKMKRSEKSGMRLFNFGIPAFLSSTGLKTCPMAKDCVKGCYARQGAYLWGNVKNAYEERLALTLTDNFVPNMVLAIKLKSRKGMKLVIRIHDSGDFYSREYLEKWIQIMELCPDTYFYAYTKSVALLKQFERVLPTNFRVIYSLGGREDHLINPLKDFHSKVFNGHATRRKESYVNATDDDMVAAFGKKNKLGLVYHGARNFNNTGWTS